LRCVGWFATPLGLVEVVPLVLEDSVVTCSVFVAYASSCQGCYRFVPCVAFVLFCGEIFRVCSEFCRTGAFGVRGFVTLGLARELDPRSDTFFPLVEHVVSDFEHPRCGSECSSGSEESGGVLL